jgi:hypothetical protein
VHTKNTINMKVGLLALSVCLSLAHAALFARVIIIFLTRTPGDERKELERKELNGSGI